MSSPPFDATLELAPRPSLRALAILFWLHAAVLGGLMLALPPGWPMALGAALCAVSWMATRRHPVFGYGPRALVRLTWHADGRWGVQDARGAAHEVRLQGDSLVHEHLLVLNFRLADGARRTRVLLGDELEPEPLRRLRARLRLERGAAPGPGA
jgi:toxin CptA